MKKIAVLIWLILFVFEGNAQHVFTTSNVNMRAEPSIGGSIVLQIPKGTEIDLDGCQNKWCEVSFSGHTGFILKQYTNSTQNSHSINYKQQAHPVEQVRHYTNSEGNVVQSPTHYDAPPEGATAQCRDGTYSFSQNHRGTCSHHGGVARWLK